MQVKVNVDSIRYRPAEDSLASRVDIIEDDKRYIYASKLTVTDKHFDSSDVYMLENNKWVVPKDIKDSHLEGIHKALKEICLCLPPRTYRQANEDSKGVYMTMWRNLYIEAEPLGFGVKLKIGNKYVIGKESKENHRKFVLYSKDIESITDDKFKRYIPSEKEMPIVEKLIRYALNSADAKHKRFLERRRMA